MAPEYATAVADINSRAVSWTRKEPVLTVGGFDGHVTLWDVGSEAPVAGLSVVMSAEVARVACGPRDLLAATDTSGLLRVWNAISGEQLWERALGADKARWWMEFSPVTGWLPVGLCSWDPTGSSPGPA